MAKRDRPSKHKATAAAPGVPTIAAKLRALRLAAGMTQQAIGVHGFVSTPGWIKLENGQRSPSEGLLEKLCDLLVSEKVIRPNQRKPLHEELCGLKYSGNRSAFVRQLANEFLKDREPVTT